MRCPHSACFTLNPPFAMLHLRLLLGFLLPTILLGQTQQYVGLRFATNIHYFPQAWEHDLTSGAFTTGVLGAYYAQYRKGSGFTLGLNINYKNNDEQGFPNLPVVMQDYGEASNVSYTGLEMDLKAGPRLGIVYPQIGYVLGYRLQHANFAVAGTSPRINRWYLMLPLGVSSYLPTRWGLVGFGAHYHVGILNMTTSPGGGGGGSIYDGGRQRYVSIEISMAYGQ
ncbi:MAG: hypothetical protein OHK0039_30290 [Bacteroidia bacterium]